MEIEGVEFVKSSPSYKECPEPTIPEYAFIGRSNVGKSSLINMLVGKKDMAKTSSTPGKTQLINHFIINDQWYLTDLPGYGYAKVSKKDRKKFSQLINNYLLKRPNLTNVFVLIDARHEPQKNDLEFIQFLGENQIAFSIIFTKEDKLRKKKIEDSYHEYEQALSQDWEQMPPMFHSSAKTKEGKEEILNYIEAINQGL